MEQKNMKTPVFACETIFSDSAEQPVDVDFTLPDYCPEVTKILKCRAISRISSKGTSGRNITVDGSVTITVMYCDGENNLCSYEYQYPFNKTFETGQELEGTTIECRTKCEYINCRAVTGRKIDIHGAIGIYISVKRRKCTDIISDVDDENIEILRGTAPATSPMGNSEKYLLVEEEIEVGQGQPAVRSLIRYDADVCVKECKLISGKAIIKGEMTVTLLYCPFEGSTQNLRTNIPFSQLLEIDGVTEQCECDADAQIAYIDIKPRALSSGECKSFQLNAKILVNCECYCNNDVDVVFDAYSRKFEADIVKNEVCFNKIIKNINETFNCKKSIEFSEGSISSVADMWCEVRSDNVKTENNCIFINGTVTAFIIAFNDEGEASFYEKPVEFQYKYQIDDDIDGITCEPNISIISSNYTLNSSGSLELRVELGINAAIYKCSRIPLVVDVNIDSRHELTKTNRGAMTIYFAVCGETVWDIARRYRASVEEIKHINDIDNDKIDDQKMILIPMS